MKKVFLAFLLFFTISVTLISCQQQVVQEHTCTNCCPTLPTTWDYLPSPDPVYLTGGGLYCDSYTAYKTFLVERPNLPQKLIPFSKLSMIGNFIYFFNHTDNASTAADYVACKEYYYDFKDKTGASITLLVRNLGDQLTSDTTLPETELQTLQPSDIKDLTCIRYLRESDRGGVIEVNNIRYYYAMGELYAVEWTHNGLAFTLSHLSDYTIYPANTFVSKLFRAHLDAEIAIAELNSSMFEEDCIYHTGGGISISSYLTYQSCFANRTDLPSKMILYDNLSQIGSFSYFYNVADYGSEDPDYIACKEYRYKFKDDTGAELTLLVRNLSDQLSSGIALPETDWPSLISDEVSSTSCIRYLKEPDKSGVIKVRYIRYYYTMGKLCAVSWIYNGLFFSLSDLTNYTDAQTDTFASKLLFTHNDAEAAIAKLNATMFGTT